MVRQAKALKERKMVKEPFNFVHSLISTALFSLLLREF
jgi:hypothetical protein